MSNYSIIPMYLRHISYEPCEKKNIVSFKIKCDCGCNEFVFYKKILSPEDIEKKKRHDELYKKYNGIPYSDKEGNLWFCSKSFLGKGRKKVKFTKSEFKELISYDRSVIKAKCINCTQEHILFDSQLNGYDAVVDLVEQDNTLGTKLLFKRFEKDCMMCEITIRNTVGCEEFMEEFEGKGTFEMYTNAFADIKIVAIKDGKKKTIFTAETQ